MPPQKKGCMPPSYFGRCRYAISKLLMLCLKPVIPKAASAGCSCLSMPNSNIEMLKCSEMSEWISPTNYTTRLPPGIHTCQAQETPQKLRLPPWAMLSEFASVYQLPYVPSVVLAAAKNIFWARIPVRRPKLSGGSREAPFTDSPL